MKEGERGEREEGRERGREGGGYSEWSMTTLHINFQHIAHTLHTKAHRALVRVWGQD